MNSFVEEIEEDIKVLQQSIKQIETDLIIRNKIVEITEM